jgi:ankyrin repeat protein
MSPLLLAQGADYNATDKEGNTPLLLACQYGNDELFSLFLQYPDLNVNASNYKGETALHIAIAQNQLTQVTALLQHPHIDINIVDKEDRNLLDYAFLSFQFKVLQTLLLHPKFDKGQLDREKLFLFLDAIESDQIEVVKSLLQELQEGDEVVDYGTRLGAFVYALWRGKEEMITLFLESLAPQEKYVFLNKSLLLVIDKFNPADFSLLTKRLVELGADVNTQTERSTALMRAGMEEQEELILFLLQQPEIDVNAAGVWRATVLYLALRYKKILTLEILLNDKRLDVNVKKRFHSPISWAIRNNDISNLYRLLNHPSFEANITDKHGRNKLLNIFIAKIEMENGRESANQWFPPILQALLDKITDYTARLFAFNDVIAQRQSGLTKLFLQHMNSDERVAFIRQAYALAVQAKQGRVIKYLCPLCAPQSQQEKDEPNTTNVPLASQEINEQSALANSSLNLPQRKNTPTSVAMTFPSWLASVKEQWFDPIWLLLKLY